MFWAEEVDSGDRPFEPVTVRELIQGHLFDWAGSPRSGEAGAMHHFAATDVDAAPRAPKRQGEISREITESSENRPQPLFTRVAAFVVCLVSA